MIQSSMQLKKSFFVGDFHCPLFGTWQIHGRLLLWIICFFSLRLCSPAPPCLNIWFRRKLMELWGSTSVCAVLWQSENISYTGGPALPQKTRGKVVNYVVKMNYKCLCCPEDACVILRCCGMNQMSKLQGRVFLLHVREFWPAYFPKGFNNQTWWFIRRVMGEIKFSLNITHILNSCFSCH